MHSSRKEGKPALTKPIYSPLLYLIYVFSSPKNSSIGFKPGE